jgi:hypothetical protein
MSQQHSFISYIKNKHSFELIIFGLNVSISYRINFKQYFRMTILDPILTVGYSTSLKIAKTKLTISNSLIKLTVKPTLALSLKKTKFTFIMKQAIKFTYSLIVSKTTFSMVMRTLTKIGTLALKVPKTKITAVMLLAKFYALWEHDNKKLWEMDNVTLADLDYSSL